MHVRRDQDSHSEGGKHAEGSQGDAIHAAKLDGGEHDERNDDDGQDHRLVAEGKTVDDSGGSASLSRASDIAHGLLRVGGVVLGDEADEASSPESASLRCEHSRLG